MSVRGIDGQMINRTTDLVRDASAQLRRGDLAQDYLAHQTKALTELQKEQVVQMTEVESASIHLDENKEQDSRRKKKKKSQQASAAKASDFVPDEPNVGIPLPKKLDLEV